MLEIYLGDAEEYGIEYIDCNDLFFTANLGSITFDESVKQMIFDIDGVEYLDNFKAKSKFSEFLFDVDKLSTGCKTAINIYTFPNIMFNTAECGGNALEVINNFKVGKIYIGNFLLLYSFCNDAVVYKKDLKTLIHDSIDLEFELRDFYIGRD